MAKKKAITIFENYIGFLIKNRLIYFEGKDTMYKNFIFIGINFDIKQK